MKFQRCHYCQQAFHQYDLRPYGPGAALVCFTCATKTPEREAEARRQFRAAMDACGNSPAMMTPNGPRPIKPH